MCHEISMVASGNIKETNLSNVIIHNNISLEQRLVALLSGAAGLNFLNKFKTNYLTNIQKNYKLLFSTNY